MSDSTQPLATFIAQHRDALLERLGEHIALCGLTIAIALGLGTALALATFSYPKWRSAIISFASLLQTIPGIALLVIAMAWFGRIGTVPALFALVLYALLPILQNTIVGLNNLSPTLAEASRALGLNRWQRLRYVRLPLAMPTMLAGLRTSAVQTIGLATLAAFIGAGGLGQFINRGLFLSDSRLILLGAIPSALLALLVHALLSLIERRCMPGAPRRPFLRGAIIVALVLFLLFSLRVMTANDGRSDKTITIGSKNFTEQLLVAEMVAQQIEDHTHLKVIRRFGLGGSNVLHQALRDGSIDLAVEYTGTALATVLHQKVPSNPSKTFALVHDAYAREFDLTWLPPLGFNNSYLLAVRASDPRLRGVSTVSQLIGKAPTITAAFDFEFAERADGYQGLRDKHGLRFRNVADMHPDLLYEALRRKQADVISAYATDGRLVQPWVRPLEDDLHFFPPYEAAIVVRNAALTDHAELRPILRSLSYSLTNPRMRRLNAAVESQRMSLEDAAKAALAKH